MTGPTHALIGIATVIGVARATGIEAGVIALLATVIGSLSPDIDGDGSITRPGKILRRFLPGGAARVLNELGQMVGSLAKLFAAHRGFFHWPILAAVMIYCGLHYDTMWLFWFGCGYLSHILADMFTVYGVPLLGPLSAKRFSAAPLRTGSLTEVVIFLLLLAAVCVSGFALLPELTQQALRKLFGIEA